MLRTSLICVGLVLHFLGDSELSVAAEAEKVDESKLTEAQQADLYISQLANLHCPFNQTTEGSYIDPFVGMADAKFNENTPTRKLRLLEMAAVPALVRALDDDSLTKTIELQGEIPYIWRVSDFAWVVLSGTLKRDFTSGERYYRSPSSLSVEEKKLVFKRLKDWYAENKGLSRDDQILSYFTSSNSADWFTAGEYFAQKQDKRAVEPLLENISSAESRTKGNLCKLVARFHEPKACSVLKHVMETADDPLDRINAAISLGILGDNSGVPLVIQFATAEHNLFRKHDDLIWFLMYTRTAEGIAALNSMVAKAEPSEAEWALEFISRSVTGLLICGHRESAGCKEIAPVLIAGMKRNDSTGTMFRGIELRIKDHAALAFLLLRDGTTDALYGKETTDDLFEPRFLLPKTQRDLQIEELKSWYEKNKHKLQWDEAKKRLIVKGS